MDVKTRLSGLDELLGVIYGKDTDLSTLLCELGFERSRLSFYRMGILSRSLPNYWK